MYEKKRILLTVKTYPEESKKHGSSICMAGITDEGEWIRLYPVAFDYFVKKLSYKMKKYVWIEAEVEKSSEKLQRKESYKVNQKSIRIIDESLTKANPRVWEKRKKLILPLLNYSLKDLDDKFKEDRTSLGLIKPKLIDFNFRKPMDEVEIDHARFLQKTLNDKFVLTADKIPHFISYVFQCNQTDCKIPHDITCEDWELFEFIRKLNKNYSDSDLVQKKLCLNF